MTIMKLAQPDATHLRFLKKRNPKPILVMVGQSATLPKASKTKTDVSGRVTVHS